MWITLKKIKKVVILQLQNIKSQIIDLSLLTYGLLWDSIVCVAGNARLKTNNNENYFNLKYKVLENNNVQLDMSNLIYKTDNNSFILFRRNSKNVTEEAKTGMNIKTKHHTLQFSGAIGWYDWLGMNGYETGIPVSFTIDIYAVSNKNTTFIHSLEIQEYYGWSYTASHVDSGMGDGSYDIFGVQSFSKVAILPIEYSFSELLIKVTSGYARSHNSDMHLTVSYLNTEKLPEKTSTDIHLIAWEES